MLNEKKLISLVCGIITIIVLLFIVPYDGLSQDYKCIHPDSPEMTQITADNNYEENIHFEQKHLNGIEIYTENNQLSDGDEVNISIQNVTENKKVKALSIAGEEFQNGIWKKFSLGKMIDTSDSYQVTVELISEHAESSVDMVVAFGYRHSLSMGFKILISVAVLFIGGFLSIVPLLCFYESFSKQWKKEIEERKTEKYRSKKSTILFLTIIIGVFSIISIYMQSEKKAYHVDELLSYLLANDTENTELIYNEKLENPKEILESMLTVNDLNAPFNFTAVWENQHNDTHPPFYYVLLHMICSVIPNVFSRWMAYAINLVFAWFIVITLYKLCRLLLKSEKAALVMTVLFAWSPAFIEMTTLLRMYVMAAFLCILLVYWIIRNWGRFDLHFLVGNAVILVCGTLTHYYFIVYAFFLYSMVLLYSLLKKDVKGIFRFGYSVVISGGVVVLIFRGILFHLFKGGRGPENIDNFFNLSDYLDRVKSYFSIINTDLFHGVFIVFVVISIVGYALKRKENEENFDWKIASFVVPCIGYFFIVSKVASFLTDRYMYPVYAILYLSIGFGIFYFVEYFLKEKYKATEMVVAVILLAFVLTRYYGYTWDYNNEIYAEKIEPKVREVNQYDCVCVYNTYFQIWPSYLEIMQYPTVTFVNPDEGMDINPDEYTGEKLVVYIQKGIEEVDEKILEKIMDIFDQYNSYEILHDDYSYLDAYVLY